MGCSGVTFGGIPLSPPCPADTGRGPGENEKGAVIAPFDYPRLAPFTESRVAGNSHSYKSSGASVM